MPYSKIEDAIAAIKRGEFVVVADDAGRENEGDLIIAAGKVTAPALAFLNRHSSGVICAALTAERLREFHLPLMVAENHESHRTAFTVTVDLRDGITTGISAADRSATLRALADPASVADDFVRPGHIFPLRAHPKGILGRPGHTEAAVDLAQLAGLEPVGVLSEIINDDGTMARGPELAAFAERYDLHYITVADLVAYRRRRERLITRTATARMPTRHGDFTAHVYRSELDGIEHVALVKGTVSGRENILVRVHSECLTGDILGSLRCDCGQQLEQSLARVQAAGAGVVVYLRGHEGRGIGLTHKLRAYALQDGGRDTVDANLDLGLPVDSRSYDIGAQILTDLGLTTIRLMSNNPAKFTELEGYNLKVVERVPLLTEPNCENLSYLHTKQNKLGHTLNLAALAST